MGVFEVMNRDQQAAARPAEQPTGFVDVMKSAYDFTKYNHLGTIVPKADPQSKNILRRDIINSNVRKYKEITGKFLSPTQYSKFKQPETMGRPGALFGLQELELQRNYQQAAVNELKAKDPEKFKDLIGDDQMDAEMKRIANKSAEEYAKIRSKASGFDAFAGTLVGGFGTIWQDPTNLFTMAIGASPGAGILKTMAVEASLNAAIEAAQQPSIAKWQRELGNKYGVEDFLINVGTAGVGAAAFSGAIKTALKGGSYVFHQIKTLPGLTRRQRLEIDNLARRAHVDENNPFIGRPEKLSEHIENLNRVTDGLNRGKSAADIELKTSKEEFDKIAEAIPEPKSDLDRAIAAKIERTRSAAEKTDSPLDPDEVKLQNSQFKMVPDSILEKIPDGKTDVSGRSFTETELNTLAEAGIGLTQRGNIPKRAQKKLFEEQELRRRVDLTKYGPDPANDPLYPELRLTTLGSAKKQNNVGLPDLAAPSKKSVRVTEEAPAGTGKKTPAEKDIKAEREAQEAEIKQMLKDDPNMKITNDDGNLVTLKEYMSELEGEEAVVKAIQECKL